MEVPFLFHKNTFIVTLGVELNDVFSFDAPLKHLCKRNGAVLGGDVEGFNETFLKLR